MNYTFAIDTSGRLLLWRKDGYRLGEKQPEYLEVEDNPELTENVKSIFMGAFGDEYIPHWSKNSAVNDLQISSGEFYCLYEIGVNNDIRLLSADMYKSSFMMSEIPILTDIRKPTFINKCI